MENLINRLVIRFSFFIYFMLGCVSLAFAQIFPLKLGLSYLMVDAKGNVAFPQQCNIEATNYVDEVGIWVLKHKKDEFYTFTDKKVKPCPMLP